MPVSRRDRQGQGTEHPTAGGTAGRLGTGRDQLAVLAAFPSELLERDLGSMGLDLASHPGCPAPSCLTASGARALAATDGARRAGAGPARVP